MGDFIFEIIDKNGRKIHLSRERWKHIQAHPYMHEHLESIESTLKNSLTIRLFPFQKNVFHYYKEFKQYGLERRYLLVAVKYLNGDGFVVTSFFTNKIEGIEWKTK